MVSDMALTRARRAYERGRFVYATKRTLPLVIMLLCALFLGARVQSSLVFGLLGLFVVWLFSWRGQALGRSVVPGVLSGLVPLGLALGAQAYGHVCTGNGCMSLCMPACSLGGVVAGGLIAWGARAATERATFIAGAGGLALLVGSLGCSCVGYGGVLGLVAGLVATLVPSAALVLRRPA